MKRIESIEWKNRQCKHKLYLCKNKNGYYMSYDVYDRDGYGIASQGFTEKSFESNDTAFKDWEGIKQSVKSQFTNVKISTLVILK